MRMNMIDPIHPVPPVRCALCGSLSSTVKRRIDVARLRSEWVKQFDIDVSAELRDVHELSLYRCEHCHLQFFDPPMIGGEGIYRELQRLTWYYEPGKWEHTRAMELIPDGSRVCEVGCGNGHFLERLRETRTGSAIGLETNSLAAIEARARGLDVVTTDVGQYAQDHARTFDVICCFQVLEHVADPLALACDAARLLKEGGRMILSVPNADSFLKWEFNLLDMPPHHATRWDPKALRQLAEAIGLGNVRLCRERLRQIHVVSYVRASAKRVAERPATRWLAHWRLMSIAARCLQPGWVRWWFRGHTIMMDGRLVNPHRDARTV